jgi:hypothetical protein
MARPGDLIVDEGGDKGGLEVVRTEVGASEIDRGEGAPDEA